MGILSFSLPDDLPAAARPHLAAAVLTGGFDQTPVPTARDFAPGRITLRKDGPESGGLQTLWDAGPDGPRVCATATLRERDEPYRLLVELARGKLNRVRTQAAEWEAIGLALPADVRADAAALARRFAAVATAAAPATPECDAVLRGASRLADRLAVTFADQLLGSRVAEKGRLPTGLGCRLSALPAPADRDRFADTFNAARVVPDWGVIEAREADYDWAPLDALVGWAAGAGLETSVGPLVDLTHGPFPPWVGPAAGDLPALAAYLCDFVETVVARYRGRVRTWQVFAGVNHAAAFGLGADDRLRLAARLVETARTADRDADLTIGVAQPWGDYLAAGSPAYAPVVFADMLIRAGMTFAAVALEVLTGPTPRASAPRDLLDTFRVLDLFGGLGVPLEVTVGATAGTAGAADLAQLALALPHVRSVLWESWAGGREARIPAAGFDEHGESFRDRLKVLRGHYLI